MIVALLAALTFQVQVTERDVPLILGAVLDSVVPVSGTVGGREIGKRPLYIATEQTARAFASLVPNMPAGTVRVERPHFSLEQEEAISCGLRFGGGGGGDARPNCEVAEDGIFVTVLSAGHGEGAGEILLNVRVRWTGPLAGGTRATGYDMEYFLARSGSDHWKVVRKGRAAAG